jgi:DNA-binding transcriptional LysR family regulator
MQFGDDNRRMPAFQDSRARYLFEAVYCGSVRAAAEKLGIVPSAVSRQISLLEEELGLALLERHRSGVVPTEAGQLLLDYHREHTAHRHDMLAKVDALRGLHSGSVSVVSGEGFAQELIDGPIRNFRQQYPGVSISLEIYGTTEIMRRIREDAAEIGLVYYPPADSHITARGAARQPMHAIVHPSTRWPALSRPRCRSSANGLLPCFKACMAFASSWNMPNTRTRSTSAPR